MDLGQRPLGVLSRPSTNPKVAPIAAVCVCQLLGGAAVLIGAGFAGYRYSSRTQGEAMLGEIRKFTPGWRRQRALDGHRPSGH